MMDKILDYIEQLITRHLGVALININPTKAAETFFNEYENDRPELQRLLDDFDKYKEHIKYYNYRVFLNRIAELSK